MLPNKGIRPGGARNAAKTGRFGPAVAKAGKWGLSRSPSDSREVQRERSSTPNRAPRALHPVALTLDSITADPAAKERARKAAREFRALRMPGREVSKAVGRLAKLKWHTKLDHVSKAARAARKPILWVQMLGDLKGYT